jgi:hypothetical protein
VRLRQFEHENDHLMTKSQRLASTSRQPKAATLIRDWQSEVEGVDESRLFTEVTTDMQENL